MEFNAHFDFNQIDWTKILDSIPVPVLLTDKEMRIIGVNESAREWIKTIDHDVLNKKTGTILHCLNERLTAEGCGYSPFCADCTLRKSVITANRGGSVYRQKARIRISENGKTVSRFYLISSSPMGNPENGITLLIIEDIQQILMMSGLLAICANCKKIRDDQQNWQPLEKYFYELLDLGFSHSLCPSCSRKLYPEIYIE